MQPGDTVHTPPNKWHWHGATPNHFMTHLATPVPSGSGCGTPWAGSPACPVRENGVR